MALISSSVAPSNTGVANGTPSVRLLARAAMTSSSVERRRDLPACRSRCRSCSRNLRTSATLGLRLQHLADLAAQALRRPAEVRLEDLADVHPRRHAERIQHDVDRRAVGHVRHVLDRHDLGDHALVAVAAGHLVARLQAALHRDVHLDHLLHARRQLVALRQLLLLLLEHLVELARASARATPSAARAGAPTSSSARRMSNQSWRSTLVEVLLGDLGALGELLRPAVGDLADAAGCSIRANASFSTMRSWSFRSFA